MLAAALDSGLLGGPAFEQIAIPSLLDPPSSHIFGTLLLELETPLLKALRRSLQSLELLNCDNPELKEDLTSLFVALHVDQLAYKLPFNVPLFHAKKIVFQFLLEYGFPKITDLLLVSLVD